MKNKSFIIFALCGIVAAGATASFAQSLGEYARKERAKEAAEPKAVKVYTNDDIPGATALPETSEAEAPAQPPQSEAESAAQPSSTSTAEAAKPVESKNPAEDKKKTREYWGSKFAQARQNLDRAGEELKLSEDELNLTQTNQVRELDPDKHAQLTQEVTAKQAAVESKRQADEKAKQALEDLKKQFDESGAPKDWLPTEDKQ